MFLKGKHRLDLVNVLFGLVGLGSAFVGFSEAQTRAFFGDTHIHTRYSFDAFMFNVRTGPDDAYRYAKGEVIDHPMGDQLRIKGAPLDFLMVSDHARYLGVFAAQIEPQAPFYGHPDAQNLVPKNSPLSETIRRLRVLGDQNPEFMGPQVRQYAWRQIIEAAERHYDPGKFTTFIGYEYTSSPGSRHLHRNVIFRGTDVPVLPFSSEDSEDPEDLWDWLDGLREQGIESLAIPHNMNGSDGWMFERTYYRSDKPIDAAYAEIRMRNEPLVENSQVKGTSDTHPLLSPNDEWADFELMELRIASTLASQPEGSYVRNAFLNGMLMEEESGINPYKFGVIAASDTHNAAGSFEEDNYWSKTGLMDINPVNRGSVPLPDSDPEDLQYADGASSFWGASGLAGVWAESNTRDAIFDSFRSKETFATSGPHIRVRFFGGHGLAESLEGAEDVISAAYANGVPMGGDLNGPTETSPSFYLWASKDPDTEPLQRLQIIKGWIEDGERKEVVVDVACSDGGEVDPDTNRCPDNGASVDLTTCATTRDLGARELSATWTDPDFDASQNAFYYVRVLENPKCRWSTWDAIRAGTPLNPDMHASIQDRAWTSPIWYNP